MAATEVKVPDIGDFKDVPIIEIHVKPGDAVNAEDPLLTLESDKATMDVPAPSGGTVEAVLVKVGDKVSEGTAVVRLKGSEEGALSQPPSLLSQQEPPPAPRAAAAPPASQTAAPAAPAAPSAPGASVGAHPAATTDFSQVHASPGVRRAARELGVDLSKVKGTGEKNRITREDVLAFLRGPSAPAPAAGAAAPSGGAGIPEDSHAGLLEVRPD